MLDEHWRGHHRDRITGILAPRFKQQRNVENDQALPAAGCPSQKTAALLRHQRMQDRLEPAQRLRIVEHARPQQPTIHGAVAQRSGKGAIDPGNRSTSLCQKTVHCLIRIEHRDPEPPEHRRGGALPHRD